MREPRWHRLAVRDLEKLHWRTAAKVDEAIQEFASIGAGVLRKVKVEDRVELRLYIAPFFAWISVTPTEVIVWRVVRYTTP
jgi:hypothetical protein